jgi:hypothetical protein
MSHGVHLSWCILQHTMLGQRYLASTSCPYPAACPVPVSTLKLERSQPGETEGPIHVKSAASETPRMDSALPIPRWIFHSVARIPPHQPGTPPNRPAFAPRQTGFPPHRSAFLCHQPALPLHQPGSRSQAGSHRAQDLVARPMSRKRCCFRGLSRGLPTG